MPGLQGELVFRRCRRSWGASTRPVPFILVIRDAKLVRIGILASVLVPGLKTLGLLVLGGIIGVDTSAAKGRPGAPGASASRAKLGSATETVAPGGAKAGVVVMSAGPLPEAESRPRDKPLPSSSTGNSTHAVATPSASTITDAAYDAMVYKLPQAPTVLDYLLLYPRAILAFFVRVTAAFGWRYVAFIIIVYGVNQGVGESFAFFGAQYFLTDASPQGLGLTPQRFAAVEGFAHIPWQMKALYGIVSDLIPIRGYHRSPYIAIASVAGVIAFALLGFVSTTVCTSAFAAVLLMLANYSMASPDVMVDASMAERTAANPRHGSDLQALAWGMMSTFSLVASAVKGYMLTGLGTRALFLASVCTSAVMLVPALRQWLGEQSPQKTVSRCCDVGLEDVKLAFSDSKKGPVLILAIALCILSFTLGSVAISVKSSVAIFAGAVITSILVVVVVYSFERKVSTTLAKASIYIFLSGAIQPSTPVLFYWYRESPVSCTDGGISTWTTTSPSSAGLVYALVGNRHNEFKRPCFSPDFVGWMSVAGYASFALGTALYNRYFSSWSYRKIWRLTQVIFVFLNLADYVWVSRWNLDLGIPDEAFVMGEEILSPVFARLAAMPMFILAARMCPPGVEATLFALTMGLSNFGAKMGSYTGIGLLAMLGGVGEPGFDHLRLLVLIRSLSRLFPIALIPFLVPMGSPSDARDGHEGESEYVYAHKGRAGGEHSHARKGRAEGEDQDDYAHKNGTVASHIPQAHMSLPAPPLQEQL